MAVFEEEREKNVLIAERQGHKYARKGMQGEFKDGFNNRYSDVKKKFCSKHR